MTKASGIVALIIGVVAVLVNGGALFVAALASLAVLVVALGIGWSAKSSETRGRVNLVQIAAAAVSLVLLVVGIFV